MSIKLLVWYHMPGKFFVKCQQWWTMMMDDDFKTSLRQFQSSSENLSFTTIITYTSHGDTFCSTF